MPTPPTPTIDFDLLCVGCGYNLRSLVVHGVCPECGREVVASLDARRLVFADPRWLRRVRAGLWVGLALPLWYVVTYAVMAALAVVAFTAPAPEAYVYLILGLVAVAVFLIPALLSAAATFLVTGGARAGQEQFAGRLVVIRRLSRIAAVVPPAAASVPVGWALLVLARRHEDPYLPDLGALLNAAWAFGVAGWCLAVGGAFYEVGACLMRIPKPRLAYRAWVAAGAVVFCGLVAAVLVYAGPVLEAVDQLAQRLLGPGRGWAVMPTVAIAYFALVLVTSGYVIAMGIVAIVQLTRVLRQQRGLPLESAVWDCLRRPPAQ